MLWRIAPLAIASAALLSGATTSKTSDADLIRHGLVAWAKPDDKGRACISCHSPQGLELAFYGFDDEDIVRRAEAHVSPAEAQAIVGMIHARRREYKIYSPSDPTKDRPLQPGGQVLPGATPAERDLEFAREIEQRLPLLARGDIDSVSKARAAAQQVLALDVCQLPVGFVFNRISEDGFHGNEHAMIADWIPDTPVKLSAGAIAARSAYQQEPTRANFVRLDAALPRGFDQGSLVDVLAMVKYRALLRLQAQLAHPGQTIQPPGPGVDNPYWDLAELVRGAQHVPLGQLGLPEDIRAKKDPGPPLDQQFLAMRLPWFWAGWMADIGLQHTSLDRKVRRGDYFAFALFDDGPYPMHAALMFLKKQLTASFDPSAWNSRSPQHFELDYGAFMLNRNFVKYAPKSPEGLTLYRRFVVNEFRTSLYLLLDETRRTRLTGPQFQELSQVRIMGDYIKSVQPASGKAVENLLAAIVAAFAKAKEVPA